MNDADKAPDPAVIVHDGNPVMLDRWVAEAFGVETRAVNQAVARNPLKFSERHAFRLTSQDVKFLQSQGVIPKPSGRGGSRVAPMAYTQLGVARLATVLDAPKALEATDLMLSVFTEVYMQIAQGRGDVTLSNPARLLDAPSEAASLRAFRVSVIKNLENLLSSELMADGPMLKDELSSVSQSAFADLKARLKTRTLENEKLAAEALKILQEVEHIKETRLKTRAETESIQLGNLNKKIDIVERSIALADRLEPSALVQLGQSFLPDTAMRTITLPAATDDTET